MLEQVDPVIISRALFSIAFTVALYIATLTLRRTIESRVSEPTARYGLIRTVEYSAVGIGLIVLGVIWLERLGGFPLVLGLLAASSAFAAREIFASIAGWSLVTSGRAYYVGDRIEMGGIQGRVIGFGVLRTSLMEIGNWVDGDQYTGRIVTVSNAVVFQQPVYNYTRGFTFLWDEIHVPITFGTNWRKAREICLREALKHTSPLLQDAEAQLENLGHRYLVGSPELAPSVYVTFDDNWIELAVRYLTPVDRRRQMRDAITRDLLAALDAAEDISFGSQTMEIRGGLTVARRRGMADRGGPPAPA